ncbi:MAG: hypothetical protein Q9197_006999, partial [Variospora fuerteventurae]
MVLSIISLRKSLSGLKGVGFWKALAIFFALLNLKHIPFAWHLRILNALLSHVPFTSRRINTASTLLTPASLFHPMILTSRAAPLEMDYNLHKSNSTYFADFDVARVHLFVRLCGLGLARTSSELWLAANKQGPKRIRAFMGGVHLSFKREIWPLQGFEMWTRLLCWDRKWFYVVTYFVEKGRVVPKGWVLQPWRNQGGKGPDDNDEEPAEGERKGNHPAIFATGIAKYVCKRGRLTVPPERILQSSNLLPPKPADKTTPPLTDSPAVPADGDAVPATAAAAAEAAHDATTSAAEEMMDAALRVKPTGGDGEWNWERVERERLRGMRIAEAWNGTEA